MPSTDKPLHVQVAEALGWTDCYDRGDGFWLGTGPIQKQGPPQEIPAFSRSWCAIGDFVIKNKISLYPAWCAFTQENQYGYGDSPMTAGCDLILTLHKEGKLKV